MIHFDTYHVHIYKPVTSPWTEEQHDQAAGLIEDAELCGLLEAVTTLYLQQRGTLGRELVAGATLMRCRTVGRRSRTVSMSGPLLRRIISGLETIARVEGEADEGTISS